MVRALVGDSTMTSVLPAPARAFGAFALPALPTAFGLSAAFAFDFGAAAFFPAALGDGALAFGFVDFFLGLAMDLVLEMFPGPSRAQNRLQLRTGVTEWQGGGRKSSRGAAQAKPPRRTQSMISATAVAGSSPSFPTARSARV